MSVPVSKTMLPIGRKIVRKQVKSLRYGIVQIVVHENRVVQIERTEKVRLERNEGKTPTSSLEAS